MGAVRRRSGFAGKPVAGRTWILARCLAILVLAAGGAQAQTEWPRVVPSGDGVPIAYEVCGTGEPTLVFVHGWSCDARYWRAQVPQFSMHHRVITLDLAGHGHSGAARERFTMASFGQDVLAVVEASGSRSVILIGHSMGGSVIAEAARLMPDLVVGLIGVDTLEDVEYRMSREELDGMLAPLKADFRTGSRGFVAGMFAADTDPGLREWILTDMSSAPPAVALSAMEEMMMQYVTGEAAAVFDAIRIPVMTINGELWPVNVEANRRHMVAYDAVILKGADHFLMMDRPEEFNRALAQMIRVIAETGAE
ncbi:MAG: alpha/beta hydrolase [Gemmatimonas sp.]|nr:alpha/beta hydrolase [Gemmatimonas sp.]